MLRRLIAIGVALTVALLAAAAPGLTRGGDYDDDDWDDEDDYDDWDY
ncbi:hypothetical protein Sme01_11770 [Sphaerisporangium melleum]|uniref:Uncharacterized protein n=1 Tax=Sphaerisporangium melleum TaxID=321316 RepID=A0A917RH36_9ACTN|nr:hypothetical protein [Sphaerisporangium melleum]GGL07363.1 hypothetical protein GCM10007964_57010 [Sphaerisporangium melleum]GII68701.1 hypothetical protein Sme01_11770 [Sphaerisporangium melleum]